MGSINGICITLGAIFVVSGAVFLGIWLVASMKSPARFARKAGFLAFACLSLAAVFEVIRCCLV